MIGEEAELFSSHRFIMTRDGRRAAAASGAEIDAAHDDAGGGALELPRLELA